MRHRWLIALLTAALLSACAKPEGGDAAKMEMRAYTVPAEQTNALSIALGNVLGTANDKTSFGKVSSAAPGQLIVLAPASFQGSIESTLRDLTKTDPAQAKSSVKNESPLRLSFWSVDAVPGNGADDPALKALMPALDEMRKQMSAVHFMLHDQMSGISDLDNNVSRTWFSRDVEDVNQPVRLDYTLRQTSGRLSLGMDLFDQVPVTMHYNNVTKTQYQPITMKSTATIALGQTLVLT